MSAYCGTCQPRETSPVPPGASTCLCAACGTAFLNVTAFDAHQDRTDDRNVTRPRPVCLDPAGMGLTRDGRGVWGTPEGHAALAARAARLPRRVGVVAL
ncbi:MAG: hypothetical protein ACHP9Z_29725 [Streptosporangiales bacterium]